MKTGYKNVNGLHMYYEIHGDGEPLVMLHGEFATTDMFAALVPEFVGTNQVILVEQQGHGHTADVDRPLSFAQMADDTAKLLKQLGVERTDILGYSGGGSVGLQLAIRHPKLVHKLALASAAYDAHGYLPGLMEGLKNPSPDAFPPELREAYEEIAPHPEDWAKLVYKSADMAKKPSPADLLEPSQLWAITAPTMLVIGDNDIILSDYAEKMAEMLRTKLIVLPGDHASYITIQPQAFIAELKKFLKD